MKKFLSMLAVVLTLGLSSVAMEAEAAKRMGSGKSLGTQRQAMPDKAPTSPGQSAATTATPGAAAAAPSRSWMGPVAGLAAGLGLAALASHFGFGDELASMLMIGLLAAAVMLGIGWFMRKRAAARQPLAASAGNMQYAPVGNGNAGQAAPAYEVAMPAGGSAAIGSAIGAGVAGASQIPADFDVAGFERHAKVNFIRLQAANDAGNLDDIRQFTTPEMYAQLKLELAERGLSTQKTEVLSLDALVLEVDEDADRYLVSVRFTGSIRDDSGEPDESFDEIWHLMKSRLGNSGWVLSGIQQLP
ncbi:MAG: Tim44 domain-containing protein [Rhodoferax sp.]